MRNRWYWETGKVDYPAVEIVEGRARGRGKLELGAWEGRDLAIFSTLTPSDDRSPFYIPRKIPFN